MTTVKKVWEMECPECKRDDALHVAVVVFALLTADGTDTDGGDHEWGDNSFVHCTACGHVSKARNFNVQN